MMSKRVFSDCNDMEEVHQKASKLTKEVLSRKNRAEAQEEIDNINKEFIDTMLDQNTKRSS